MFILGGAQVNGHSIVPEGWLTEATTERTGIGEPGRGYGYQWWTYGDGSFAARGIFGQGIFIDPKRQLVIASNANWAGGARDARAMTAGMSSTERYRTPWTQRLLAGRRRCCARSSPSSHARKTILRRGPLMVHPQREACLGCSSHTGLPIS
jgi:CubicO group peptidase (beta-lactamase class C family)